MNERDFLSYNLSNQYEILDNGCGTWARRCFCQNEHELTRTDRRRGGHEVRQPIYFYASNLLSQNGPCTPEASF